MTPIEGALTQGVVFSYASSLIVDKIRHSNWRIAQWLKPETADWIIKVLRAGVSLANSAGILYVWDPAEGVLTISGLTIPHLLEFGRIGIFNYVVMALSEPRAAATRVAGETPIVAATQSEVRTAGADVIAVDKSGTIEAAQEVRKVEAEKVGD